VRMYKTTKHPVRLRPPPLFVPKMGIVEVNILSFQTASKKKNLERETSGKVLFLNNRNIVFLPKRFAMKHTSTFSSLLLALVLILLPEYIIAQVWNNSTSASWQSDSWSFNGMFPGAASTSLNVFITPLRNIIITDAAPPFPIGNLSILATQGTFSVALNGSGTLVVNGDLTVNNTLIIGSGLRLMVYGSLRGTAPILVSSGASLRLNSTSMTAVESTVRISAPALSPVEGKVELGAGWNGGFLPGAVFGDEKSPFQGRLQIASTMTLSSPLYIGAAGVFDFSPPTNSTNVSGGNKLILASSATIHGTLINAGLNQFFVTTAFPLTLGNVGNTTFPIGPSTTVFAPLNIINNAAQATFSVKALPAVTQPAPFASGSAVLRQSIVNQQWNVSQLTGVTPGFAVSVTPLWVSGQENGGFNRAISVVNAFTTTNGTVSSGAGAAASDPTYAGYFRSGVTITQIATNNLNNTPILVSSQPAPNVLAFSPPIITSGATLTITGNRFAPGASVSIDGVSVPASNVTLISGVGTGIDTLRVVVPATTGFRITMVKVTQTGGSSTATGFCFIEDCGNSLQQAIIYKVIPNPIPAGLGDVEVVIDGATFGVLTPRVVAAGNGITSTITPSANTSMRITATIPGNVVRNIGAVVFTVTSLDRLPFSTTVTVSTSPLITLTSLSPSVTSSNLQPFTILVNGNNFSTQSIFTLGNDTLSLAAMTRNADGSLTARLFAPVGVQSGNLTVTNLNNQAASLPFLVGTVGVLAEAPPHILVFPNPMEDIVSVEAYHLASGSISLTITNALGQCVFSTEELVSGGEYRRKFHLSGMPSGVYVLEVRDGMRRTVQKIVKQ